jgi:hypothetical protein
MLFKMPMSILVTDDEVGFVTSDNPAYGTFRVRTSYHRVCVIPACHSPVSR